MIQSIQDPATKILTAFFALALYAGSLQAQIELPTETCTESQQEFVDTMKNLEKKYLFLVDELYCETIEAAFLNLDSESIRTMIRQLSAESTEDRNYVVSQTKTFPGCFEIGTGEIYAKLNARLVLMAVSGRDFELKTMYPFFAKYIDKNIAQAPTLAANRGISVEKMKEVLGKEAIKTFESYLDCANPNADAI